MKTLLASAALLGGLTLLSGTASAATPYECQLYAQQVAEQQYPTGGGAVGGGVFGGILGAGIAAATGGNVGSGAAIGAGAGLVVGSSAWQAEKRRAHDLAYSQCISGATPVYATPPPAYAPPPPVYPTGGFNGIIFGASSVNVRSGPGTMYGVIGQAYANQGVSVIDCVVGWCRIYLGAGVGYVSQMYVRPI
jgi:hypothetical protein